jgi:hypothetical protein
VKFSRHTASFSLRFDRRTCCAKHKPVYAYSLSHIGLNLSKRMSHTLKIHVATLVIKLMWIVILILMVLILFDRWIFGRQYWWVSVV